MANEQPPVREREPVALVSSLESGIKALILALIALGLAFNVITWSPDQNAAVLGVVAALFVLISTVTSVILRQKVTPVSAPRDYEGRELTKD